MSIFPAYSNLEGNETEPEKDISENISKWLQNNSFELQDQQIRDTDIKNEKLPPRKEQLDEKSVHEHENSCLTYKEERKKRKTKHDSINSYRNVEISGDEYYIDKNPVSQYKVVKTLHKPACPRYHSNYIRKIGMGFWRNLIQNEYCEKTSKRYYQCKEECVKKALVTELSESEYDIRIGQLNRKTMESPTLLEPWMDLICLQEQNPNKLSRHLLAERKIDIVKRALAYHPRNEDLYRLYIKIISANYPSFEISKTLDQLLAKDPYSYTLWTAQIMTTQGSMARCIVPDVLRIYELCMQKMHFARNQEAIVNVDADELMLKLFHNCALFLQQAGLSEQFHALIKLALELNIPNEQIIDFGSLEDGQNTLIEYEELILQSGLPMNEIWLRIEKLRQGFNFLPCPVGAKCSDPQRIVFNEDVVHYVYPLKSRDKLLYLMLLILRLLKVPFVHCDGLANKLCTRVENMGDSDAIEDVLAVFIRRTFVLPQQQIEIFFGNIYELVKEMAVSPTFLSSSIGHELYIKYVSQMLMYCANSFAGTDERKRIIFVLLWCRFERVLLIMQKCNRKSYSDYVKAARSRFRTMLKQEPNRNVLHLYTEYACYEFEALDVEDSIEPIKNIFNNIITSHSSDQTQLSDLCHAFVTYAEILISRNAHEEALQVLVSYVLSLDIRTKSPISSCMKLTALQKITEQVNSLISIERTVTVMVIDQYLLPDFTISLIKLRVLILYLMGQMQEAISYLEHTLDLFRVKSDRQSYLRENIYEILITVSQRINYDCSKTSMPMTSMVFKTLNEFPRNLMFLQHCGMLTGAPWFKIRGTILRISPNISSVIFLIVTIRYRFMQSISTICDAAVTESDIVSNKMTVRNRILNVFKELTAVEQKNDSVLHRNSLFWRFYLRFLSDQNTAFEISKRCLLTALDDCPWSKALYLDGATYVPQELSHLQDLIIEKQLRIYALPEELEILREK